MSSTSAGRLWGGRFEQGPDEAAWQLGVEEQTGTLEVGKMADVVVWSGDPFSVYTHADLVYVDGQLRYDRSQEPTRSDFELGQEVYR